MWTSQTLIFDRKTVCFKWKEIQKNLPSCSSWVGGDEGTNGTNWQTNLVIMNCLYCFGISDDTATYHLGLYKPSTSSTKELHASMRQTQFWSFLKPIWPTVGVDQCQYTDNLLYLRNAKKLGRPFLNDLFDNWANASLFSIDVSMSQCSVTRFGEIPPLWKNLQSLG